MAGEVGGQWLSDGHETVTQTVRAQHLENCMSLMSISPHVTHYLSIGQDVVESQQ